MSDDRNKTKFINTPVDEKMFQDVNKEAHKREMNRSEYMRSLINKDLYGRQEESSQNMETRDL